MADEPTPNSAVSEIVVPEMAVEDDRLIRETGTDARVAAIVIPILRPMGFRLVLAGNDLSLLLAAARERAVAIRAMPRP